MYLIRIILITIVTEWRTFLRSVAAQCNKAYAYFAPKKLGFNILGIE